MSSAFNAITATNGSVVYPDDCEHDYTYDVDGNITTDTFTNLNGNQYRITYTWLAGELVHETRLVAL